VLLVVADRLEERAHVVVAGQSDHVFLGDRVIAALSDLPVAIFVAAATDFVRDGAALPTCIEQPLVDRTVNVVIDSVADLTETPVVVFEVEAIGSTEPWGGEPVKCLMLSAHRGSDNNSP
jgi:hypothetical protein